MCSQMSFYRVGKRGTVQSTPDYNPVAACEQLYEGMKGLGTDEDAIINVVATHTFHQRQELKQLYRQKYGKDLVKELDSELSFSFSKTVLALMERPETYIITCIHQAISKSRASRLLKQLQKIYKKGLDSDEYSLLALLCPRSNDDLEAIKTLYKLKYDTELEDDIGCDLGDDLRSLILDMISGGREQEDPDIGVDLDKVLEDADNLYAASFVPVGEICGTKERVFQQILNTRSYEHLRKLFPAYLELSNKTIEDYVENTNLIPELKEAYQAILKILQNEPEFYAERLREAIEGLGTDDDTLITTIVLRSEIDLRDILLAYEKKFGVTLQEDVKGDTSGDYEHILLKILNVPEFEENINAEPKSGLEDDELDGTTILDTTIPSSSTEITSVLEVESVEEPEETNKEIENEVIIVVDPAEEEPVETETIPSEEMEMEKMKNDLSQDVAQVEIRESAEDIVLATGVQKEEPRRGSLLGENANSQDDGLEKNNNDIKSTDSPEESSEDLVVIGG